MKMKVVAHEIMSSNHAIGWVEVDYSGEKQLLAFQVIRMEDDFHITFSLIKPIDDNRLADVFVNSADGEQVLIEMEQTRLGTLPQEFNHNENDE